MNLGDHVVTLRPWTAADAPFMAEAFRDPLIRRYNGECDDAAADIAEFEAQWRVFETDGPCAVVFAIADATSGELAGCCGIDEWTTDDVVQFGYWLAPGARGRGYATRAVRLLTDWLFALGAARVVLKIKADNEASLAVAQRAGFVHRDTSDDVLVFAAVRA